MGFGNQLHKIIFKETLKQCLVYPGSLTDTFIVDSFTTVSRCSNEENFKSSLDPQTALNKRTLYEIKSDVFHLHVVDRA